jgi:hypothetical protein
VVLAGILVLALCSVPVLAQTVQVSARVAPFVTASTVADGILVQSNVPWTMTVTTPESVSVHSGTATGGEMVPAPDDADYVLVMEP